VSAFETNLVAIRLQGGTYGVASQTIAHVDSDALRRDGLLHDVSSDGGYIDEGAVVERDAFSNYLLPESNPWHGAAKTWYRDLPQHVVFILVHRAEWESGLGD